MSVLQRPITLKLNAAWQVIGYTTPQDAIVAMCPMPGGTPGSLALDIDGTSITPTKWEDWLKLPVREGDEFITTSKGKVRCPLVIVEPNYADMPMKEPRMSKEAILERDGYKDQYTGEPLTRDNATLDHVIPKDVWRRRKLKGSPNRWDNLVACKDKRNFAKGNKTNHQAKLVLLRKPKAPKKVPVSVLHSPKLDVHRPFFPHRQ